MAKVRERTVFVFCFFLASLIRSPFQVCTHTVVYAQLLVHENGVVAAPGEETAKGENALLVSIAVLTLSGCRLASLSRCEVGWFACLYAAGS